MYSLTPINVRYISDSLSGLDKIEISRELGLSDGWLEKALRDGEASRQAIGLLATNYGLDIERCFSKTTNHRRRSSDEMVKITPEFLEKWKSYLEETGAKQYELSLRMGRQKDYIAAAIHNKKIGVNEYRKMRELIENEDLKRRPASQIRDEKPRAYVKNKINEDRLKELIRNSSTQIVTTDTAEIRTATLQAIITITDAIRAATEALIKVTEGAS